MLVENSTMKSIQIDAEKVEQILGLTTSMVGVKFIFSKEETPVGTEVLTGHRYCQALMKARHGNHVLLDAEVISCQAAAAAFGFKPFPNSRGKNTLAMLKRKDSERIKKTTKLINN